jgi:hypothetical protein
MGTKEAGGTGYEHPMSLHERLSPGERNSILAERLLAKCRDH